MDFHAAGSQNNLITYAVIALVVVRFLVRELRDRTMAIGRLFIAPAIVGVLALGFAGWATTAFPTTIVRIVLLVVGGAAVGVVLGILIARFTTVRPSPMAAKVIVRGSIVTVALWIGSLLVRMGARTLIPPSHVAGTVELNIGLVAIVAAALLTVRYVIYRRAQTLPLVPAGHV